jgi:ribosomal protein S12 methylthiotransferase accessory factor
MAKRKGVANAGLRFRSGVHVELVPEEGAYVLSERSQSVLKGPLSCKIASLVDGSRSADDIVKVLNEPDEAAKAYYALELARRSGAITEAKPLADAAEEAFWDSIGAEPLEARARIGRTAVSLKSFGGGSTRRLRAALSSMKVKTVASGDLTLVVVDDYLNPKLEDFNRAALAARRPWMPVKLSGELIWVGPLFEPYKSACWACAADRIRGNREVQTYLQWRNRQRRPFPVSRAALPLTLETGAQIACLTLVKHIAGMTDAAKDLLTFDTTTMDVERHVVTKRPQCPACGEPQKWNVPRAPILESRPKSLDGDEGYRVARPDETIERYQHHVSPIVGAVSELVRTADDKDSSLHSYVSGHNLAVRSRNLEILHEGLRSKSAGKGATDAQAKAGALCEALERYCGVFRGDEPRRRTSYRRLGDSAIHPNSCMLFSERQLREREKWLERGSRFSSVPLPFDEKAEIDWTPVWSITRECWRHLPTGYLYFSYPHEPHELFFWADSNGNAAGNSIEEAVLQGFFELVERDGVCLWWYNRVRRPRVDIASFEDPWVNTVSRRYEELGRPLWVLDVTTDLGIPVFVAASARCDKPVEDILIAAGAHFDPRIALRRAIGELNQFLPAVLPIQADGTGEYAFHDSESQNWWKSATRANQPYLLPDPKAPTRALKSFKVPHAPDLLDDIGACRSTVEALGLELLVLDQTRPDIGLPVVKVIVPGLRHFWARLGPGRLYDVPVKLGWLDRALAEEDLNPIPVFL